MYTAFEIVCAAQQVTSQTLRPKKEEKKMPSRELPTPPDGARTRSPLDGIMDEMRRMREAFEEAARRQTSVLNEVSSKLML
jgi:hypothetical protein